MKEQEILSTKLITQAWYQQIDRATKMFNSLSDVQLQRQIAPNKNTGVYLLGHLTAIHDAIFPLFGFGDKLFPELEETFIKNPDASGLPKPSLQVLRSNWLEVNTLLSEKIAELPTEEWFNRHTAIAEEDFIKEPHRNKLNVLLGRTTHIAYHLGQLRLLKD